MITNTKLLEIYSTGNMDALHNALIENIREENAKSCGSKSQLSIIKSMMKKANSNQPAFFKYNPYGDRFAFLDGYRIFVTDNNYGYDENENPFDVARLLHSNHVFDTYAELDTAELKIAIAENKKRKTPLPYVFKFENGIRCGINPQHALDAIQFTGSNKFYCDAEYKGRTCNLKPMQLFSEDGVNECLVLPVNIPEEVQT